MFLRNKSLYHEDFGYSLQQVKEAFLFPAKWLLNIISMCWLDKYFAAVINVKFFFGFQTVFKFAVPKLPISYWLVLKDWIKAKTNQKNLEMCNTLSKL